jgi:hypothetical protein
MSSGNAREMRDLMQQAKDQGFIVTNSKRHWRVSKGTFVLFTSKTPSDWRSVLNTKAQLKRAGFR